MQDYSGYGQPPTGDFGSSSTPPPLPPMPPPPQPPRRRIGLLSYLAVALAAGALGAGTVVAVYHPASSSVAAAPQPSSSAIAPAPLPSTAVPTPSSGVSGSLSSVERGLVIINTTLQYSSEQAAGTGMVINADGLVLTNNHVIENATKITATVAATGKNYLAKVVGYDVTGDIALIKLQNPSGLHPVPIGDSSKLKTGASVVALGNAEGQSQIVPAPGQITGLNQTITASDQGGTVRSETLHGMIQTNANVVAGDSGGSLVNSAGKVIGIDTAGNTVSSPQQSVSGYAIPIKTALSVASQILAGHASSTIVVGYPPFIGIYVGPGTSSNPQDQASQRQQQNNGFGGFGGSGGFGNGNGSGNGSNPSCYTSDANLSVPSTIASVNSGTLVLGTICNSPASAAGLTAGSVITSINGHTVGSPQSLATIMSKLRPGDTASVTWVTPNNQRTTGNLALTAGPPL
jgi:S1-C subfamily serine protease